MRNEVRTLYCGQCGNPYPLIEPDRRKRSSSHIKNIYCYKCRKVTPHAPSPNLLTSEELATQDTYLKEKDSSIQKRYNTILI